MRGSRATFLLPLLAKGATGRIRRRACNFSCRVGWRNQARETGCARPLRISSPFHVDGAYPSAGVAVAVAVAGGQRQTRTENTAQAACLDHRQPSDPGRRPKPSFLLLTAFRLPLSFSPSLSLTLLPLCHPLLPATPPLPSRPHQPSLLPPLAPRPSRRRTPPRPPPPPPPLRLPLLRLSVSSSRGELRYSRKAHVSARIAVACTRRYASSSTFVTSQPPRTLRLLLAAVPFSLSLQSLLLHLLPSSSRATEATVAATSRSRRSSFRNAAAAGGRDIFANPSSRRLPSRSSRSSPSSAPLAPPAPPPPPRRLTIPSSLFTRISSSFSAAKRS